MPDDGLPTIHPRHPERDRSGRFVQGHPGRPREPVSRLRSETQRIAVAHFARNQDRVLDQLLKKDPVIYYKLVMRAANEGDSRAVLDLDPAAPTPVDLDALNREAAGKRAELEALNAKHRAEYEELHDLEHQNRMAEARGEFDDEGDET